MKGGQAAEGRKKKKGWGGRGGGSGLASQEKFNKTISDGGRGPRQSAGEALQFIFVLDPTPSPVLLTVPHKYLKCGCCNNTEAPEMESRANRGWMAPMFVQSLNKATLQVPLKAKPNKQEPVKGTHRNGNRVWRGSLPPHPPHPPHRHLEVFYFFFCLPFVAAGFLHLRVLQGHTCEDLNHKSGKGGGCSFS